MLCLVDFVCKMHHAAAWGVHFAKAFEMARETPRGDGRQWAGVERQKEKGGRPGVCDNGRENEHASETVKVGGARTCD